jgi:hypothetical protein
MLIENNPNHANNVAQRHGKPSLCISKTSYDILNVADSQIGALLQAISLNNVPFLNILRSAG